MSRAHISTDREGIKKERPQQAASRRTSCRIDSHVPAPHPADEPECRQRRAEHSQRGGLRNLQPIARDLTGGRAPAVNEIAVHRTGPARRRALHGELTTEVEVIRRARQGTALEAHVDIELFDGPNAAGRPLHGNESGRQPPRTAAGTKAFGARARAARDGSVGEDKLADGQQTEAAALRQRHPLIDDVRPGAGSGERNGRDHCERSEGLTQQLVSLRFPCSCSSPIITSSTIEYLARGLPTYPCGRSCTTIRSLRTV